MFGMRGNLRTRLGERVRLLRQAQGWSQEDLGERSKLSYKFIGEIERGLGNPSVDSLERLCAAFDVDVTQLFGSSVPLAREGPALTPAELANIRKAIDSADLLLKRVAPKPRRRPKR